VSRLTTPSLRPLTSHNRYAIATSILELPLPQPISDAPSIKKQRTDIKHDTVEGRLALEAYARTDDLLADLRQAIANMKRHGPQVNGHNEKSEASQLQSIESILDEYATANSGRMAGDGPAFGGQVMTVRSVVEGGVPKQLFTGLRIQPANNVQTEHMDARTLPSGLDMVEAMAVEAPRNPSTKDSRTFGDVFRQIRNTRHLEPPPSSRATQGTPLRLEKPFESSTNLNKDDYRLAALTAGSWLEYATSTSEPPRPPTQPARSFMQHPQALFNASFSSFAPSEDNTNAIVPRAERSRLWYKKHSTHALRRIMTNNTQVEAPTASVYPEIDDTYQQLIEDFEPDTAEDANPQAPERATDETEVLDEVSELLQTLSSYQKIRDLDKTRVHSAQIKPTGPETETFELLRQQLSVLVATLPPFAVAKLDGDQLKDLGISTTILIRAPEIAGVGQPDEGTLHRQREALSQQAAMARPVNPPAVRNSYTSTASAPSYNNQARSYSGNASQTPSMPGYAQRNAQMYNTPRAHVPASTASYSQTPSYQRPTQPFPGATIQQYQRMQNGYGQNMQTPYQQRPTQAPYQAQGQMPNSMQYGRSASPAKPVVNGQGYKPQTAQQQAAHTQRSQYSTPAAAASLLQGPYAQANSHATIQQIKAAQQAGQIQAQPSQSQSPQPQAMQGVQHSNAMAVPAQSQRQASGTPQPASQSQTPQQQHASIAAIPANPPASNALSAVPGQIGQAVQASQQQAQRATSTPTPVAAGAGGA